MLDIIELMRCRPSVEVIAAEVKAVETKDGSEEGVREAAAELVALQPELA
jgi:hypothetical protein